MTTFSDVLFPHMLDLVRRRFKKVHDSVSRRCELTLIDCLMSGLAVFLLKFPSLLQFDQQCHEEKKLRHNLKHLFGVERAPSDTYLRERLDEVDPDELRRAYSVIFSFLQRRKALEVYSYLDGYYLISCDGTGVFESDTIHCESCCVKHHRDGRVSYYHQMLGAVMVHPKLPTVIPLAPEAILKKDGEDKNDCERNAAKRLLPLIRREHPHLKMIILEDALAANAPHIRLLQSLKMKFIIGAKPDQNAYLFEFAKAAKGTSHEEVDINEVTHRYYFVNGLPLNDEASDVSVNFLEYWEIQKNGRKQHFTWITDIPITTKNVYQLMRGGRARWKIENETFNTLKNLDYHFEHNFGHGYHYLSTVLAYLMFLAFLIDQAQQLCCSIFALAFEKTRRSKSYLWWKKRGLFSFHYFNDWADFYRSLIEGCDYKCAWVPDTS